MYSYSFTLITDCSSTLCATLSVLMNAAIAIVSIMMTALASYCRSMAKCPSVFLQMISFRTFLVEQQASTQGCSLEYVTCKLNFGTYYLASKLGSTSVAHPLQFEVSVKNLFVSKNCSSPHFSTAVSSSCKSMLSISQWLAGVMKVIYCYLFVKSAAVCSLR